MKSDIFEKITSSENSRPTLIAEMSGNHASSLHHALKFVDSAISEGADIIKFQVWLAAPVAVWKQGGLIFGPGGPSWVRNQPQDCCQEAHAPRPVKEERRFNFPARVLFLV